MFNRRLKKDLQDRDDELFQLRQLVAQYDRGMLSICLDADLRLTAVNEDFARALGYSREQLQGRLLSEIVPPYVMDLPCFRDFNAAIARSEPVSDDYRFLRSDASLAWINLTWCPIRGRDGRLSQIQGYGTEVSRAIEQAKENEAFINALIRSTAVIQFRLDGTVVTANTQFLDAMGYTLDQIVGKKHSMFCTTQEAASSGYAAFWQTLNRGEFVASLVRVLDRIRRVSFVCVSAEVEDK